MGNRRKVKRLWETLQETDTVCIALGDIDHFKKVNDTYGHDAGDAILRDISALLTRLLPTAHILARIGGEEFMVVLRHTTPSKAYAILEQVRKSIEVHTFHYHDTLPISLTMSFGLAVADKRCHLEKAYAAADTALYFAKQQGRNRTEWVLIDDSTSTSRRD